MKTIWKYELETRDSQVLNMPEGKILCVQNQNEKPCIWLQVDEGEKECEDFLIDRHFEIFGTGNPIHEDMGIRRNYIGTYQLMRGSFVGHLFERLD